MCTDKNGQPLTYKDKKGVEKKVTVTDGRITAIVQNMEQLISFSWGQFRFVDSYAFLSSSLDRLVTNTPKENLRITRQPYFCFGLRGLERELMDKKFDFVIYEHMDDFSRLDETC